MIWLQGSLPSSLGNLTKLREMDMAGNRLSGVLPDFVGQLPAQDINLANNTFRGPVPATAWCLGSSSTIHLEVWV